MSDYTGSNVAGILEAVTADLAARGWPVVCELGDVARSAQIAAPRLIWTFVEAESEPADLGDRDPDGKVIEYERQIYAVEIWGENEAQAHALRFTLKASLDALFSPWAAAPHGKVTRAPDRSSSSGAAFVMGVQLRVPVYEEIFQRVVIESTDVHGAVSAPPASPEANP